MSVRTVPDTRSSRVRDGSVPLSLVLLTLIPVTSGSLRLLELAGGPHVLPANPRIDASPAPVVVHVIAAALYAFLGAFQFSARLRRHRPGWHRRAGRVLVVAGLVVAGSGLWMTLSYSGAPGGVLLWCVRLLVGTAMGTAIGLGFTAIRRHDIAAHRAWMVRAYALAVGAGTQTFTQGVGQAAFGTGGWSTGISISSGWVINVLAAEWLIRRHS